MHVLYKKLYLYSELKLNYDLCTQHFLKTLIAFEKTNTQH